MSPSQSSLKILGAKHSSFSDLKPRITVIGVGGAGGNAVNNMIRSKLEGVDFIVCNTDAQALGQSLSDRRIQLGLGATRGLGAGSRPDVGRVAAEEALEDVVENMKGSHMLFITAGMGGGTGTGAAPVLARAARELGILTVGVVTKPFHFEGIQRMRSAEKGLDELQQFVDTLIVIPNQNLFRIANEKTTFADAFKLADDVLHSGVRGVTDLMIMPGLINLDFADVRSVMGEMGKAMMGTGEAQGERRAIEAAESAISNPLLDDVSMRGARGVLINITGGLDMTLFEVDEAANRIREEVDTDAQIIFGSTFDEKMEGIMRVSVVATGIDAQDVRFYHTAPQMQHTLQEGGSPSMGMMSGMGEGMGLGIQENLAPEASLENDSSESDELHLLIDENLEENKPVEKGGEVLHSSWETNQSTYQSPRKPGLFERLTGLTLSKAQPNDIKDPSHLYREAPSGQSNPPSSDLIQGTLPGIQTSEGAVSEEELQIPAFLRRGNP